MDGPQLALEQKKSQTTIKQKTAQGPEFGTAIKKKYLRCHSGRREFTQRENGVQDPRRQFEHAHVSPITGDKLQELREQQKNEHQEHHALTAPARALETFEQADHNAVKKEIEDGKQKQRNGRSERPLRPRHQHAQPHTEEPERAGNGRRINHAICRAEEEVDAEGDGIARDFAKAEAGRVSLKENGSKLPDQEDTP